VQITYFKHKVALVLLGGVIIFMACSTPKFFREIHSARWPATAGIITQSSMRKAYDDKGFSGYIPEVQYRYAVGALKYLGTRIDFHTQDHLNTVGHAQSLLSQFPTGKVVFVYYDPKDPQNAVLQPGIQSEQTWILYLGLGYIVMCSVAFLCVLYHYRRAAASARKYASWPNKYGLRVG
jgi:hypothetical protein